ncbi:helix-turn-helix transcriptional regulator [Jeotgalibacillus aurantiacus]|uniref:helix-turn-helix transcriptional regulator n=1 Tax=Jeotgalibacillus aurantiacus TaxID=2763266 RepID=UPI001D0A5DAA
MNAELLKQIRKVNNLTQEQFASEIGVSRQTIAFIETDRMHVSDEVARKVRERYGIERIEQMKKTADLFGGDRK